jgi:hypothetical protein
MLYISLKPLIISLEKIIFTCAQNISKSPLSRQKNPNVQLGSIFFAVNFFGDEHE